MSQGVREGLKAGRGGYVISCRRRDHLRSLPAYESLAEFSITVRPLPTRKCHLNAEAMEQGRRRPIPAHAPVPMNGRGAHFGLVEVSPPSFEKHTGLRQFQQAREHPGVYFADEGTPGLG